MQDSPRRAMPIVKASMRAPNQDVAYWRTQSFQARIDALEEIRREYHLWKYGDAEPRIQRGWISAKR